VKSQQGIRRREAACSDLRELEQRRENAANQLADAEAELAAAKALKKEADDGKRALQRAAANLAYERLRGDDPVVPEELAPLVSELEPAIRADVAARAETERASLSRRYVKLDEFEQPVDGTPARRLGFADSVDEE
jgi:hypothetical protein